MADILHKVKIDAPPEAVFHALTSKRAIIGWWTRDVEMTPKKGEKATFGFNNRSTVFNMKISELKPVESLKMDCSGDPKEWKGTKLHFKLAKPKEGGTMLTLKHSGWKSTKDDYTFCNTTWGALMFRLKDYVEGRSEEPLFTS